MWRWGKRITVGVSLLILLIFTAAWIRSYFASEAIMHVSYEQFGSGRVEIYYGVAQTRGAVNFTISMINKPNDPATIPSSVFSLKGWNYVGPRLKIMTAPNDTLIHRLGFQNRTHWPTTSKAADPEGSYKQVYLTFPHWSLALCSSIPLLTWFYRHKHRPKPGHCPACGYDLRASPQRCAECGRAAEKEVETETE